MRRNASPLVPRVAVVSTRSGELAWLAPGAKSSSTRVVLDRPGHPPRTIARAVVTDLAVDDGSTLRWNAYGRNYAFYDLPRPHRPPCPRRGGYAVLAENAELRVTRRVYRGEDDIRIAVVRACVRGEGPDRVLAQADIGFGGSSVGVAGVAGTVLVLVERLVNRYDGCGGGTLFTAIEARTTRTLRETWMPWCGEDPGATYTRDAPTAVTADGVLAWLVVYDAAERLLVAGPDGTADELDRGPPGTITQLHANGEALVWAHAGEPRSADPP
jgi:hypothetical protein